MRPTLRWLAVPVTVLAVSLLLAACDSDDDGGSEAERQELADFVVQMAGTNGPDATQEEIDFYMSRVTDNFVVAFGANSVEECAANAAECIGEALSNPRVDPADVDIDGDDATITLVGDDLSLVVEAIREDDIWKLDGIRATSDEIADGVDTVDLALNEFAFAFDADDENLTSGTFAFRVHNEGEQVHEAALFQLPAEGDLVELLGDESADVAFLGLKFPLMADDEVDWAVPELAAGRYALICFLPDTDDPERTPHAFKGMTAEFTVQ